jgi:hypothetical protein
VDEQRAAAVSERAACHERALCKQLRDVFAMRRTQPGDLIRGKEEAMRTSGELWARVQSAEKEHRAGTLTQTVSDTVPGAVGGEGVVAL